jgi:hypothetical protein
LRLAIIISRKEQNRKCISGQKLILRGKTKKKMRKK